MTNYVITLYDYMPSPRADSVPWTQAQIGYSPIQAGPFTLIQTIALSPVDSDPAHPKTRNLTTTLSPAPTGWFKVTFVDAFNGQEPTDPVQFPAATGGGAANPTLLSARYGVRHRIRDGVPLLDNNPVPFNMVRLEDLSDQIPIATTPTQTIFQTRYSDVPTQRYMNAQVVAGTLIAYVDDSWTGVTPIVDVDINGNFQLPVIPLQRLLITYAWQYLSDGEIDQFVDESRQWLREFSTVPIIPDGLVPALISYASSRALYALQRSAILAPVKAGDSDIDWSALAKTYKVAADSQLAIATQERELYYTQGPEAKDPTAVDVFSPSTNTPPYTPIR